jgi:large subunit ribosomal protein L18e
MRKPDNPELMSVTRFLKNKATEFKAPIWRTLAKKLEKSNKMRCVVNLSRINRYTEEGETVTIPGKVLGGGTLDHKVTVAAFQFSDEAKKKIGKIGGECLTFSALIEKNHKGKNLKIIG